MIILVSRIIFPFFRFTMMIAVLLLPQMVYSHSGVLEEVMVVGRKSHSAAAQRGANSGFVSRDYIESLALERTGDVLELVPGLVATQHSGSGKANQYFLRGFNLDHGTDFLTRVDYVPVNMVSHGHGHGYTDLNFLIPELVQTVDYRKGPFYSDLGDFSGTGEAHIKTVAFVPSNTVSIELGEFGYKRAFSATQLEMGDANWLFAGEFQAYDGPWKNVSEDVGKTNIWIKYASGGPEEGTDFTVMVYDNSWNAADQIPLRAISQNSVDTLSTIDPSSGGESYRYSVAWQKRGHEKNGVWFTSLYAVRYGMDLWSNFTYFTRGESGDQIYQLDDRLMLGGDGAFTWANAYVGPFKASHSVGVNWRYDDIQPVGLWQSSLREAGLPVRQDRVRQWSGAVYWQMAIHWLPKWTSTANVRWNYHAFDVNPELALDSTTLDENSGDESEGILTAAIRNRFLFGSNSSGFLNVGRSYHSNDARGVISQRDPVTADAISSADALVPVDGVELGASFKDGDGRWQISTALWGLRIDSELLFVGDEGLTEDSGSSSTRRGLESSFRYNISAQWPISLDYSISKSQLNDVPDEEKDIPGALERVLSLRTSYSWGNGWFASIAHRNIGGYAIGEGQRAAASAKTDLKIRYLTNAYWRFELSVINIFNSSDRDIEYFYESQLLDESAPVADRHIHRFVPRTLRLKIAYEF